MAKINLFFDVYRDAITINSSTNYDVVRLKSGIRFKTKEGRSEKYAAVIDSGAHISVVPLSV